MFPMLFFMVSCRVFSGKLRKPSNSRSSMRFAIESISVAKLRLRLVAFLEKTLEEPAAEFRAVPVGRAGSGIPRSRLVVISRGK